MSIRCVDVCNVKVNAPAVVLMVLLTIYIISATASLSAAHALQHYEELIIVYPQGYDVENLKGIGCSIERVFTSFNTALLTCPTMSRDIIEALGIEAVPNSNVSIAVAASSIRVYGSVRQVETRERGIPLAWSWAVSRVGADTVWRYLGVSGYGATIAILDTGVDPTHPLLAGKLKGWIEFDRRGRPVCSNPRDTYGHGTWVASIAAGGDTSNYIFGVAPNAKIIAALVLPGGYGTVAQVLAGLEWSLEPYDCTGRKLGVKPTVVSMSFGVAANYSNVFLHAIAKLIENGIVPVAAIGNSGPHTTSNPGNIWGVIGVGATNFDNNVAWFSSYEDVEWPEPPQTWPFKGVYQRVYRKPDVVAPGVDVPGAFPGELLAIGSGTSASTPIVAGIAAMVSEILASKGVRGAKLVEEVYSIIVSTADNISVAGSGNGLIDAFKAVAKALGRTVNSIEVEVEPSTVALWEELNVGIRGAVDGMEIAVYIAGVEVYRGVHRTGKLITVRTPPTHIGGNEVTVIDRGGLYYGETLAVVVPSIHLPSRNATVGRFINIAASGLGIGDLIAIYMEDSILTLGMANLRGSYLAHLAVPYVHPGRYSIVLQDFTTPSIRLYTTIDVVNGERRDVTQIINRTEVYNYTTLVREYIALPITVSVKQHYIFNVIDYVDIVAAHPNVTVTYIDVKSLHDREVTCSVANITEIYDGVYRLWFTISALEPIEEEDIILNLGITLGYVNISYPVPIKLLAVDPVKEGMGELEVRVKDLNSSLLIMNVGIQNVSRVVAEMLESLDEAKNRIDKLDADVMKLEKDLAGYEPTINYAARRLTEIDSDVEFIERMMYLVLTVALTSIAIAVVGAVAIRRAAGG
ncbi:MAG: S8 family serine peptidase [Ignisphaera sp.]|nr:S8 family serine peptidase [Ignisphaera sp.]MCX8168553.1 S8 family serine peptidase [Ignisphaera sp.]MDW8085139.1 S8 family serine peptidase [Ignisphaera sp.]